MFWGEKDGGRFARTHLEDPCANTLPALPKGTLAARIPGKRGALVHVCL